MVFLISNQLSESFFDFGKWSNGKSANTRQIQSYLGQVLSYGRQTQSPIGKYIGIWESSVIFEVCFDMVDFFFQQTLDNQQKIMVLPNLKF